MSKEIKISSLFKFGNVYELLLYNIYKSFKGIFTVMISIVGIIALITGVVEDAQQRGLLIYVILFCIGFYPLLTIYKAKKQMDSSIFYKNLIHYRLNSQGIHVSQDNHTLFKTWNGVQKVVEIRKSIVLYLNEGGVFILPKGDIGNNYDLLKNIILGNTDPKICKFKK